MSTSPRCKCGRPIIYTWHKDQEVNSAIEHWVCQGCGKSNWSCDCEELIPITGYYVHLPEEVYEQIVNALPAEARFTDRQKWAIEHVWFYTAEGSVVIFSPAPVRKLKDVEIIGFNDAK